MRVIGHIYPMDTKLDEIPLCQTLVQYQSVIVKAPVILYRIGVMDGHRRKSSESRYCPFSIQVTMEVSVPFLLTFGKQQRTRIV